MLIKDLFRNPFTQWLKYLWQKISLEFKYKNKHFKIGYLSLLDNIEVGNYNTIYEFVTLKNVQLNDFTYISKNSEIMNTKIGKFCSIGEQCKIGLGIHPTDLVSSHPIFYSSRQQSQINFLNKNICEEYKEITINNDVWIGSRAMIIDGVTINNGAIIAAGSIVTRDVPAYAIVAGIPAKIIRYRFSEEERIKLEKFKWWDKDIHWLKEHASEMLNINTFIKNQKL